MTDTPNRQTNVLRAVLNYDAPSLTQDATADALTAPVEKSVDVRFKGSEPSRLPNVGKLADLVDRRVGART